VAGHARQLHRSAATNSSNTANVWSSRDNAAPTILVTHLVLLLNNSESLVWDTLTMDAV
jgi:hypothetical protein